MSHTVRDTRTIERIIVVTDEECTAQETQHDSRIVFVWERLPAEMKEANNGSSMVFRPHLLTMRWLYRKLLSSNGYRWELRDIDLAGRPILKDGSTGKQEVTKIYWPRQDDLPRFIEELAEKYRPDGDHPFALDP
jgi:hypothetical protein